VLSLIRIDAWFVCLSGFADGLLITIYIRRRLKIRCDNVTLILVLTNFGHLII
jgi:hypothetical protein